MRPRAARADARWVWPKIPRVCLQAAEQSRDRNIKGIGSDRLAELSGWRAKRGHTSDTGAPVLRGFLSGGFGRSGQFKDKPSAFKLLTLTTTVVPSTKKSLKSTASQFCWTAGRKIYERSWIAENAGPRETEVLPGADWSGDWNPEVARTVATNQCVKYSNSQLRKHIL